MRYLIDIQTRFGSMEFFVFASDVDDAREQFDFMINHFGGKCPEFTDIEITLDD